jgi:hypothetical protein
MGGGTHARRARGSDRPQRARQAIGFELDAGVFGLTRENLAILGLRPGRARIARRPTRLVVAARVE